MKRIIAVICTVALALCALASCGGGAYTKHEWVFDSVEKVVLKEDLDASRVEELMEEYSATDKADLEAKVLVAYNSDEYLTADYLKFSGRLVYKYDIYMDREATYVRYETKKNEGFFSVYTELDIKDGNPDPYTNPPFSYDAETNTMRVTMSYMGFNVTVKYRVK